MSISSFRNRIATAVSRITSWPRAATESDITGLGNSVSRFVLYLLNATVTVMTLLVAIGKGDDGIFELAVALVLFLLAAVGELASFCSEVMQDETDERYVMRCFPPGYFATLVIMLGLSFLLLLVLLMTEANVFVVSMVSLLLVFGYVPITVCKCTQMMQVFRNGNPQFAGYYNYIAVMLRHIHRNEKAIDRKLNDLLAKATPGGDSKRSEGFFNQVWDTVLWRKAEELMKDARVSCPNPQAAKKRVWFAYCCFNLHCSENYMSNPSGHLDRHKVAACYMYAIVAAAPLVVDTSVGEREGSFMANEQLAVVVGASILCSFVARILRKAATSVQENDVFLAARLRKSEYDVRGHGLKLPNDVGHGETYLDSVYRLLRYTTAERNYNLLTASLQLFEWEHEMLGEETHRDMLAYCRQANGV